MKWVLAILELLATGADVDIVPAADIEIVPTSVLESTLEYTFS
jgi:hypothetical protein